MEGPELDFEGLIRARPDGLYPCYGAKIRVRSTNSPASLAEEIHIERADI